MTKTRPGTVAPLLILLLSTLSCGTFMTPVKPTQVVDIAPMLGKSLTEMEAMLGPSRAQGICHAWDLPEGMLIVCYKSGDSANKLMDSLHYRLPPTPLFGPMTAVGSPEEMAALVRVDLQGRKPKTEIRGGYGYGNYILNGKAVNLFFDGGQKAIVGVRVDLAPPATDDSPTNTSTQASTTGVTVANFNRLQNGMTYAEVVKILGKEGNRESVMESGGMKIEMYKWVASEDGSDARLDAFFKNGKLDKKSQFALK